LTKTIIIDNVAENFRLQKDNGLNIKNFEGDENDNELNELIDDLKYLVLLKVDDVRKHMATIQDKMDKRNMGSSDDFSFVK
jgi:CTD small phosphatase-like protein 2